jgi:biotin-dependent carboxylase-like uncharacterized protein
MRATLRVLAAGPGVTIQDGGRSGFLRFGVTESGPMDRLAHATANRAAGVALDSAGIEVSLGGLELGVEDAPLTLAVAGGAFDVRLDGEKLPSWYVARVGVGQKLRIAAGRVGAWCYLAVAGRLLLEPELGSVSMHTRSGIGGRQLEAGCAIGVEVVPDTTSETAEILAPWLERRGEEAIRVILGPQADYFDAAQIEAFLGATWTVSHRSDRMAYLLERQQIQHVKGHLKGGAKGFNIVSDGTAAGSIQVPGEGRPIVLMADRPPTGGYPKIATVIGADLGKLAQLRPGQTFRFARTTIEEAVEARRGEAEALVAPVELKRMPHLLREEMLLRENLVDGVTSGWDEPSEKL